MNPEFPIRLIYDDGECLTIRSQEELMEIVDSIDSGDPAARVWIRDERDRSVRLKMRNGFIEVLETL